MHERANVGTNFSRNSASGSAAPSIRDIPATIDKLMKSIFREWPLARLNQAGQCILIRITGEEDDKQTGRQRKLIDKHLLHHDPRDVSRQFIVQKSIPDSAHLRVIGCDN